MATYIPNATQTTEPVESRTVESAALEFRTLKASVNSRVATVQSNLDAQDVRLTAIENALPFIGEGGLPGTVYVQRLSGTGAQTVFTLNTAPQSNNVVDIYINGIYQNKDTFTVSGADVIFSKAPPAGTNNIEVQVTVTIALGETDASLVTYGGTTVATQLDAITANFVQVTGNQTIGIPTGTILGRASADTGDVEALTGAQATALLSAASETVSGLVALATTAEAQAGTDETRALSPLRLRDALNASGSAPIYACRAWVNFNGTGTVAIQASGNVSSVTDNGAGDYTVNFTTAMPDANYSVICNCEDVSGSSHTARSPSSVAGRTANTNSAAHVIIGQGGSSPQDRAFISVAIFR